MVASTKPRWLRHIRATESPSPTPSPARPRASALLRRCRSAKVSSPELVDQTDPVRLSYGEAGEPARRARPPRQQGSPEAHELARGVGTDDAGTPEDAEAGRDVAEVGHGPCRTVGARPGLRGCPRSDQPGGRPVLADGHGRGLGEAGDGCGLGDVGGLHGDGSAPPWGSARSSRRPTRSVRESTRPSTKVAVVSRHQSTDGVDDVAVVAVDDVGVIASSMATVGRCRRRSPSPAPGRPCRP